MHLFLTFSAALGNSSKLDCARLHENWRRLGIARSNKFVGLCSRLAQTLAMPLATGYLPVCLVFILIHNPYTISKHYL